MRESEKGTKCECVCGGWEMSAAADATDADAGKTTSGGGHDAGGGGGGGDVMIEIPEFALPQRTSRRRGKRTRGEMKDEEDEHAISFAGKPEYKFEYLDHTADVQIHSWGATLREAFEHAGHAMYNYMVPLDDIRVNERVPELRVRVNGHDEQSLLYNFMQELLFDFHTEFRACWYVCSMPLIHDHLVL